VLGEVEGQVEGVGGAQGIQSSSVLARGASRSRPNSNSCAFERCDEAVEQPRAVDRTGLERIEGSFVDDSISKAAASVAAS
jgi:hypothetical protein